MATSRRRPRLAVVKFASCDGCQLSLLDCEDDLLAVAGAVDIAYFLEASRAVLRGPYDLTLVEGSVTTAHDAERLRRLRRLSRTLVAIGACAVSGGIQALRNTRDIRDLVGAVYPRPDYIDTLATSIPVSDLVPVDLELRGCPVDKRQLLEVVDAFLHDRRPVIPAYSVCVECKERGTPCVMVARGTPCMGPVTVAGCGAICPAYHRGCYGCFGPVQDANTQSLASRWRSTGAGRREVALAFRGINAAAQPFRTEADRHER